MMMHRKVGMQVMEVCNRMANHIGCTDQSLSAHHEAAVEENRILVRELRWLFLDHFHGQLAPTTASHLHMWLEFLVRIKGSLANHALVRTAKKRPTKEGRGRATQRRLIPPPISWLLL